MIKEIGSYIYDETENGAVILECDKNISGDVEIQESFFGVPVVGIAAFAFMKCKRMLGVQIPDSVTEIGRGAFYGCTEMSRRILEIYPSGHLTHAPIFSAWSCREELSA